MIVLSIDNAFDIIGVARGSDQSIIDVTDLNVDKIRSWIGSLKLTEKEKAISNSIFKEINSRLKFLVDVRRGRAALLDFPYHHH